MASRQSPAKTCAPVTAGYANYFEVGHNAFEFLIDLGQIDPDSGEFNVTSRIAIGPTHAKLFARLLDGAVSQYEKQYAPIAEIQDTDLLDSALEPSPEFERRAIDARRRHAKADPPPAPTRKRT